MKVLKNGEKKVLFTRKIVYLYVQIIYLNLILVRYATEKALVKKILGRTGIYNNKENIKY